MLFDDVSWDVSSVQISHDGGMLLVGVNEDGATRYYTADPRGTAMEPLRLFDSGQFSAALHPTEPLAAVNHVDASGLARAYVYDLTSGELTRWAGPEARALDSGEARLVRYPTFDEVDGEPRRIAAFVYAG